MSEVNEAEELIKAVLAFKDARRDAISRAMKENTKIVSTKELFSKEKVGKIEFKPKLHYNWTGDFIQIHWSPNMANAETVHGTAFNGVQLYRDVETKEIVGVKIHGIMETVLESLERYKGDEA